MILPWILVESELSFNLKKHRNLNSPIEIKGPWSYKQRLNKFWKAPHCASICKLGATQNKFLL